MEFHLFINFFVYIKCIYIRVISLYIEILVIKITTNNNNDQNNNKNYHYTTIKFIITII